MEDLKIEQKLFDMIEYTYPALAQFPKSEKFALAADIKRCLDVMLERCVEAQKKYFKKTTLQDFDVENAKFQRYIRLALDLGFLPIKKYQIMSEKSVEIGRMLGGWIKNVNSDRRA